MTWPVEEARHPLRKAREGSERISPFVNARALLARGHHLVERDRRGAGDDLPELGEAATFDGDDLLDALVGREGVEVRGDLGGAGPIADELLERGRAVSRGVGRAVLKRHPRMITRGAPA